MKIIGQGANGSLILTSSTDEVARVMGYPHDSSVPVTDRGQRFFIGMEVPLSKLWNALQTERRRHDEIKRLAEGLRSMATAIEAINGALAPIPEPEEAQS